MQSADIVGHYRLVSALGGGGMGVVWLAEDHPMFRLIGAGRSGGAAPGARDKHVILDE